MTMSLLFDEDPVLFDLMMALPSRETHHIALKTWPYLGRNSAIPGVQIRLRDLTKSNDVEFSIRMILKYECS